MRLVLPLFDGFTALDLVGPYEILRMLPGAEIVLAGERAGQAVPDGVGGLSLVATHARAEVRAADVLLVPGGPGARRDVDDPALLEWITAVHATTRWTASVCTGALLLGAAGLLTGKTATTHWSAVRELESYGATYTPERVVTHPGDRLIIGAGVSAGIDLALTLAAELTSPSTRRRTSWAWSTTPAAVRRRVARQGAGGGEGAAGGRRRVRRSRGP